jgi:formylmethanofuran dehydrogenase subunit B
MNNQNLEAAPVNATCPACGLLCDDITINSGSALSVQNGCTKGIRFFENAFNASASASPMLSGKPANLETAIDAAAEILSNSSQALFAGLGTEVHGMRAILNLAKKTNATLDHMHSESTVSNTRTMQNSGWLTTTLAEVKNRADVILAIGTDITSSHPRFFQKLAWNTDNLFDKPTPELIFLGAPEASAKANIAPDSKAPTIIPAAITQLPEIINALNTLLNGKKINAEMVAGIPTNTLMALIEKLKSAKYAVIVWSASALKISHAELTIQNIVQLISKLNENSRAAGLPLNSGDGDSSVNNVSTWLSGYPTRSRFNNGIPEYDTYHFSTKKQLANCDALLWVSTFNPLPAPDTQAPVIVIGHPDTQFERMPDVFIPVGIPGVDHSGQMFRMDSSITLPLKKLRDSKLPGLSEVIGKIEAKLSNRIIDGTAT